MDLPQVGGSYYPLRQRMDNDNSNRRGNLNKRDPSFLVHWNVMIIIDQIERRASPFAYFRVSPPSNAKVSSMLNPFFSWVLDYSLPQHGCSCFLEIYQREACGYEKKYERLKQCWVKECVVFMRRHVTVTVASKLLDPQRRGRKRLQWQKLILSLHILHSFIQTQSDPNHPNTIRSKPLEGCSSVGTTFLITTPQRTPGRVYLPAPKDEQWQQER